jgi:molecular chaperone DnaJ
MPNDLERPGPRTAPSGEPERVCFSDEIGIDFPSVPTVVGRVCDAFRASAGGERPYEAHIALSIREALGGRDVVVRLPLRRTCSACGGRGEVWNEACGACCGIGDALDHHDVHVAVPAGVRDGTRVRLTVSARQAPVTLVDLVISVA